MAEAICRPPERRQQAACSAVRSGAGIAHRKSPFLKLSGEECRDSMAKTLRVDKPHPAVRRAAAAPLFVCERAFAALALLAAGAPRVVRELVVALDADAAGQQEGCALAREAAGRGKRVAVLEPAAYGGYKDVSEAWMAGVLRVGTGPVAVGAGATAWEIPEDLQELWAERTAIIAADGHLPRAEAERLARVCLQAQREAR